MSKAKNIQDNIKQLVSRYPKVTENYNLLVTSYWYVYENARTFADTAKCTSAESITRAFRKLVSEGEIEVSKQTRIARDREEAEFKDEYGRVTL